MIARIWKQTQSSIEITSMALINHTDVLWNLYYESAENMGERQRDTEKEKNACENEGELS